MNNQKNRANISNAVIYYDIWYWDDKRKRRVNIEDKVATFTTNLFNSGGSISFIDNRSETAILLSDFEQKWNIHSDFTGDYMLDKVKETLTEYPNINKPLPKKKFFEKTSDYKKRCSDFRWFSIEPTEREINQELSRLELAKKRALESNEYKQLLKKVEQEKMALQKQNNKRYFELLEIKRFTDYEHMCDILAEIGECCKKDSSLKDHYLSLQIKRENSWRKEVRARKLEKEKRLALKEKRAEEKKAMLARANKESRQHGAQIKIKLKSDHNCPYCNGELGSKYHADHIIPIAQGGLSVEHNMVNVCESCNLAKSDLTLFEFSQKKGFDYLKIIHTLQKMGKRI